MRKVEIMRDNKVVIAPSILSANFACLGEQVKLAEEAGADAIHIDVMDGHFVPNITFGPDIVAALKKVTSLPLDVHLMIDNPERYLAIYAKAGADYLTVHLETCPHIQRVLEEIRELKMKVGISLNPGTSLTLLEEIWPYIDLLLIMTVNPGFGGQKFIKSMLNKIAKANQIIQERKLNIRLSVDGGINQETIPWVLERGVDWLVIGSYIFKSQDITQTIKEIKKQCLKI